MSGETKVERIRAPPLKRSARRLTTIRGNVSNSEITSLASRKLKFQVVFSSIVVAGALLITWLILGKSSPFVDYFTSHSDLPDAWRTTMVIPFFLSVMISGNPHSPPLVIMMLALTIQWSIFGYLLSIPMAKLWTRSIMLITDI